jgi:hypothetical protein
MARLRSHAGGGSASRAGIQVSRETLRQWLIEAKLWRRRRARVEQAHVWRARRARYGELVQWDSSARHSRHAVCRRGLALGVRIARTILLRKAMLGCVRQGRPSLPNNSYSDNRGQRKLDVRSCNEPRKTIVREGRKPLPLASIPTRSFAPWLASSR